MTYDTVESVPLLYLVVNVTDRYQRLTEEVIFMPNFGSAYTYLNDTQAENLKKEGLQINYLGEE